MNKIAELVDRILELAVEIQQIPAPTFDERQRAEYLYTLFLQEGLCDVEIDAIGNVYGRLPGGTDSRPVVVSAHTDTVFPKGADMRVRKQKNRIFGPGIGDNSLGVAGLLGLCWYLDRENNSRPTSYVNKPGKDCSTTGSGLPGDLWLVANVGEEGLGNLNGMQRVVDRFGDQTSAYIILEGMSLGHIYHRALEVNRFQIQVRTRGGHSWVDFGQPSAIHIMAALITRLNTIYLPAQPRTTLNVGVISGGTSVNTIAAESNIELDLRSKNHQALESLVDQVKMVADTFRSDEVEVYLEPIGKRPGGSIPANHPLVLLAKQCLIEQGIHPVLTMGSTDANIPLSKGFPAICVGLTTGSGSHTTGEYINISPLDSGMKQLVSLVRGAFLNQPLKY